MLFGPLLGLSLLLSTVPSHAAESEDSQTFITGFNAFQKKDYQTTIDKMTVVMEKYPDTPLRDMVLFWLARAHYKAGHRENAAKYLGQFLREFPDSPLKSTLEDDLVKLAEKAPAPEPDRTTAENEQAELKARSEKTASDQAAAEKAAVVKAAETELAAVKAMQEKAEAERLAAEKAAAEKAAADRVAQEKAEAERAAAERARQEQIAVQKAAAEKAAAERAAQEKAESERLAAANAAEKAKQEQLATERAAREKAEAERQAAQRSALEKAEREKAEQVKVAVGERDGAKAAATEHPAAPAKGTVRKGKVSRTVARKEKVIAEYKSVIDNFPDTRAARAAQEKLRSFGIVYPPAGKSAVIAATEPSRQTPQENAQILALEVTQAVDFALTITPARQAYEAGKRYELPLEVVNRGNGRDSFYLEAAFPADFNPQFTSTEKPGVGINMTPPLAPGEKFNGVLAVTIPRTSIDGQRFASPVKVGSQNAAEFSQTREVVLTASAPLLRAVVKPDTDKLLPGERITYRVVLLNAGSASAQGVDLRLAYPPQYEPVDFLSAGFKQEMKAALVLNSLQLNSGESREVAVTFQLKDDALAHQELFCKADLVNNELQTQESFLSRPATVRVVSGVAVRANTERLVVIPGQKLAIPVIITNTGNARDAFSVKTLLPENTQAVFYLDSNRDGVRQDNEQAVASIGPLAPREESYLVMELATSANAADQSGGELSLTIEPESDKGKSAQLRTRITYSRPVLELALKGKVGKLKPGEIATFELQCANRGSNTAKGVEIQSHMPEQVELISSEIPYARAADGVVIWRFEEMGSGERRSISVTIRVKSGVPVGTGIQVKNVLKYQDQLGNRY